MKKIVLLFGLILVSTQLFSQKEREPIFPLRQPSMPVFKRYYLKIDCFQTFNTSNFLPKSSFGLGYNFEEIFYSYEFKMVTGLEYQYRNIETINDNISTDFQYHGLVIPSHLRFDFPLGKRHYWLDFGIDNYIIFHAQQTNDFKEQNVKLNNRYQPYFHFAFTIQAHYSVFLKLSYNKDLVETDELNWQYRNVGLSVLYRL